MDKCGFEISQARRHVSGHAEVRVLVDGAGDQARHVGAACERDWERAWKGGRCLDGGERALSDVVRHGETENGSDLVRLCGDQRMTDERRATDTDLIVSCHFLDLQNCRVHVLPERNRE